MSKEVPPTTNIIIADDHPLVRSGLRNVLEEESGFKVVGEASNAAGLFKCIRESYADVVITDLTMPGYDGADLVAALKKERPSLAVIVLSLHPEERFAARAMAAGASVYLTKDKPPESLIDAIRQVTSEVGHFRDPIPAKIQTESDKGEPGVNATNR